MTLHKSTVEGRGGGKTAQFAYLSHGNIPAIGQHPFRLTDAVIAYHVAETFPKTIVEDARQICPVQGQDIRYIHELETWIQIGLFLYHPVGDFVVVGR